MAMRISGIWRNEDGSALLEGTVLMPFLMALILGTLDFSFFFYQQHLVATGVRDAARYLARTSNPSSSTSQTTAQNLATTGVPSGGTNRVTGFNTGNVAISISYVGNALNTTTHLRSYREAPPECGGPDQIAIINVTGSLPYASFGFLTYLGLSSPTVSVTHSERCIGLS